MFELIVILIYIYIFFFLNIFSTYFINIFFILLLNKRDNNRIQSTKIKLHRFCFKKKIFILIKYQ